MTAEMDVAFAAESTRSSTRGVDATCATASTTRRTTARTGRRCARSMRRTWPAVPPPTNCGGCCRLMIGELDASHLGISRARRPAAAGGTGRLGLQFDAAVRSQRQLPDHVGAAARAGRRRGRHQRRPVRDRRRRDAARSRHQPRCAAGRAGRSPRGDPRGDDAPGAADAKTSRCCRRTGTEIGLNYRQWVEDVARTCKASGGRLGYVHIPT